MPKLYEHYEGTVNLTSTTFYGAEWAAQTFTPSTTHTIISMRFWLLRVGSPGTVSLVIKAVDVDGKPTGADLASGTTNGNNFSTSIREEEITLGAGTKLTASTKYVSILKATSGDASNLCQVRIDLSGTYAGGGTVWTYNSGVDWTLYGYDLQFEEFGAAGLQVRTLALTNIASTTATGNGSIDSTGYSAVTEHGHCWATTVNPTTADSKTTKGAGSNGTFTSAITGLVRGTKYFTRAYATNTEGTVYGSNVTHVSGFPGSLTIEGQIAVVETRFHYFGADGKEYYLQGTAV